MNEETQSYYSENKFDLITARLSIYQSSNVHALNKIKKARTKNQYESIYIISDLFIPFNTFICKEGNFNYSQLFNKIPSKIEEDKSFTETKEFSHFNSETRTNYIMNTANDKPNIIHTIVDKEERLTTALN